MAIGEYFLCSIKMSNYPHRRSIQSMHPYQGLSTAKPGQKKHQQKKGKTKQTRILSQTQIRDQKFSHEATQNQADYAAHVFSQPTNLHSICNCNCGSRVQLQPEIFGNVWLM